MVKRRKKPFKFVGIILLLLLISVGVIFILGKEPQIAYTNQCSLPSCPSGYTSVDVYCDESDMECYRECEKPLTPYCGNYGSWSYKSKQCLNYGPGSSCTTPNFYESSDECYQFYAKTTVNYPLTLNGAIDVKATNSWNTEYSGCSGYSPISVSTSTYDYGRGNDGGSRTASGSYSSCGTNAITSATKIETRFYYRTASIVEGVDTIIKECSYDCNTKSDCGTDGYIGSTYCKENNVYQMFRTYSCSNYDCSYDDADTLKETCDYGCSSGVCITGECNIGDEKCEGPVYYTCSNQLWVSQGEIVDKCGVSCTENDIILADDVYYICVGGIYKPVLDVVELTQGELQELLDLIYQLNATIEEKARIIDDLTTNLEGQIIMIENLELTIQDKAYIIDELETTLSGQVVLINQLELNIQEKTIIIQGLTSNIEEQADIISALELTLSDQAAIILNLGLTVSEQVDIITALELTISGQAEIINNMNLQVSQQAEIIQGLEINLQQKINLINQLEISNQNQQILINQMVAEFSEQEIIISQLTGIITEDAAYIGTLELAVSDLAGLIDEYGYTISEQAQLIEELELSVTEAGQLISQLELTTLEQAELISQLHLSITEQAHLIEALNLKIQDDAEIIANLELSLEEEARLIEELHLTLEEEAIIIDELKLSLEDERELVTELRKNIEEQQELLDAIKAKRAKDNYVLILIIGVAAILLIILIVVIIRRIKKKKK